MSGDTVRLSKAMVGKLLGGRNGNTKETKSKKATMLLHQNIIFSKNDSFFKNMCCYSFTALNR